MNTEQKQARTVTFQPSARARAVLAAWEKAGFKRSQLINLVLSRTDPEQVQRYADQLEKLGIGAPKAPALDMPTVLPQVELGASRSISNATGTAARLRSRLHVRVSNESAASFSQH
jgi:hypothetical protein